MGRTEWPEGIGPHQRFYIDDDENLWLVTGTFAHVNGRVEVVGMEARSVRREEGEELAEAFGMPTIAEAREGKPAARITAAIWRDVGKLATSGELRAGLLRTLDMYGLLDKPGAEETREAWRAPETRPRRDGYDLEEVAEIYRAAKAAGEPTGKAVEARLYTGPDNARKLIQKARQAGLLPPVERKSKPEGE